jgi:hypothetical protein
LEELEVSCYLRTARTLLCLLSAVSLVGCAGLDQTAPPPQSADSTAGLQGSQQDSADHATNTSIADELIRLTGALPDVFVAAFDAPPEQQALADYVCDGVQDEEEINAAIAQVQPTGGIVQLSVGTFNIVSHVDISCDNLTFRGLGPGTLLRKTGTDTWSVVNQFGPNHDIRVEDIHIDGRDVGDPQVSGNKCLFLNGNVDDYTTAHHFTVRRVTAHNATAEAICIDYAHYVTIEDCHSYDSAWAGATVAQVRGARISNNHVERCGTALPSYSLGAGINVQASEDVVTEGNFISNCYRRGIGVSSHLTSTQWRANNIIIRDNFVDQNAYEGIRVWSYNGVFALTNVTVVGNQISQVSGSYGIAAANVSGFEVLENAIDGVGPCAIWIDASATDGLVHDNLIGPDFTTAVCCTSPTVDTFRLGMLTYPAVTPTAPDALVQDAPCSGNTPVNFPVAARPNCPRQVSWTFNSHGRISGFTLRISGVDHLGRVVTEVFTDHTGWSGTTSNAFLRIDTVRLYTRVGDGVGDSFRAGFTDTLGLGLCLDSRNDLLRVLRNGLDCSDFFVLGNYSMINTGPIDVPTDITIYYREPLNHRISSPLVGDFDEDGDVDQNDWRAFSTCLAGPSFGLGPGCQVLDIDGDGDVDLVDQALFERLLR